CTFTHFFNVFPQLLKLKYLLMGNLIFILIVLGSCGHRNREYLTICHYLWGLLDTTEILCRFSNTILSNIITSEEIIVIKFDNIQYNGIKIRDEDDFDLPVFFIHFIINMLCLTCNLQFLNLTPVITHDTAGKKRKMLISSCVAQILDEVLSIEYFFVSIEMLALNFYSLVKMIAEVKIVTSKRLNICVVDIYCFFLTFMHKI
ncbi:hypothetical protein ACJX0J_012091, partial [Zea mays]